MGDGVRAKFESWDDTIRLPVETENTQLESVLV